MTKKTRTTGATTDVATDTPPLSSLEDLPKPPKSRRSPAVIKIDPSAYKNAQLDLFQMFICNGVSERDRLSNTIDIWDSVPRYSISRQEMNKRRDPSGNLPLLNIQFEYRGQSYTAKIQPAIVEDDEGVLAYYPSANEELVEDALRKLAARQNQGFFEQEKARSGVAFSLYELREELAARGHTRSFQEIIRSLTILQKSHIELRVGEGRGESFVAANYLPTLAAVTRKKLVEDPGARWVAQFHPLVTQSIDRVTYRQFNYVTMMGLSTQLARWIHKQLSIKFTFAGVASNPFEMRYSTIKRDSNLLNRGRERDNIRDVDEALAQLTACQVLRDVQKNAITAARGKVVEVIYQLFPTPQFVKEMKASNKRLTDASVSLVKANR